MQIKRCIKSANSTFISLFVYTKTFYADFGFYFKMFTSIFENVLICFMKQLFIALNQIQPKGALVHVLGRVN